jgi:AcrR family transcriptional regulator
MSSAKAPTRVAILVSARRLLEARGYFGVGLEDIAADAGVSRQAIYLHFGSKSNLLLELARHVDESQGLPALVGQFRSAPTSLEAMDRLIHVLATYGPRVLRIALVMDGARQSDSDAMDAWRDRMMSRLGGMRWVIEWIARDGLLVPNWTVEQAAEWWWALSSPQVQELLTEVRDWSAAQYEDLMRRSVRAALTTAPLSAVVPPGETQWEKPSVSTSRKAPPGKVTARRRPR